MYVIRGFFFYPGKDYWGRDSWSNEYTDVSGNRRAVREDFCPSSSGMCFGYPSGAALLRDSMSNLGWRLKQLMINELPIE